jgi:hypothetical protein
VTSMPQNSAKANWTLEEMGWQLNKEGDIKKWVALTGWLLRYAGREGIADRYVPTGATRPARF